MNNTKGLPMGKTSFGPVQQNSRPFCETSLRCYINRLTRKSLKQESASSPSLLTRRPYKYFYSTAGLTIKTLGICSGAQSKVPQVLKSSSTFVGQNTLAPSPVILKSKLKGKWKTSPPVTSTLSPCAELLKPQQKQKPIPLIGTLKAINPKRMQTEDQVHLIGWEMY